MEFFDLYSQRPCILIKYSKSFQFLYPVFIHVTQSVNYPGVTRNDAVQTTPTSCTSFGLTSNVLSLYLPLFHFFFHVYWYDFRIDVPLLLFFFFLYSSVTLFLLPEKMFETTYLVISLNCNSSPRSSSIRNIIKNVHFQKSFP